ncbi:MAG: 2-succinyl-6-hydroxy-2,4-cyclohexadiene-1-carboxylate synthase [Myxococcota bacterium]
MGERALESGRGEPPLLLLHGFTGSADAWRDLLPVLGKRARTVAIDLPGHGPRDRQAAALERITPAGCVAAVGARLDALGIRRAVVLGYSMGARVALRFARDHPERVAGLVLESAAFGIRDPEERAARRRADEALAAGLLRDGLAPFVDAWMRQPLFASQASLPAPVLARARAMRMESDPAGLAACLRGLGQGSFPPAWDALPALRMPVLLLAGEHDAKYRDAAAEAAALLPRARVAIISGAGHTVHLEQPTAFAAAVEAFLIYLQGESP